MRLLQATIMHRATATAQIRVRMLADMLTNRQEPSVRDLVAAIVQPAASQLRPGSHYLGLQARLVVERGPFHFRADPQLFAEQPESTWTFLREAIRRQLTHLSEDLFDARWDIAVTSILTLASYQLAMARQSLAAPLDVLVPDLVEVLTGALTAGCGRSR
jgi:hypothetical protein